MIWIKLNFNQLSSIPDDILLLPRLKGLELTENKLSDTEKERLFKLKSSCAIYYNIKE